MPPNSRQRCLNEFFGWTEWNIKRDKTSADWQFFGRVAKIPGAQIEFLVRARGVFPMRRLQRGVVLFKFRLDFAEIFGRRDDLLIWPNDFDPWPQMRGKGMPIPR